MDEMVHATQKWLNEVYGDDPRYNVIEENGKTGWPTIYALTRALQIELGIQSTADSFGPTSKSLYSQNPLQRQDGIKNNKYAILQGALWCKGYNPGHYLSEGFLWFDKYSRVFDVNVENAIKQLKTDMGFQNPDGVVTTNVMVALLSMDAFKLLGAYGGKTIIRNFQQELNRKYEAYTGIMPCDGLYGRNTNKAVIYAIQAEEGLPIGIANGSFGPTTKGCCPAIPYTGIEKDYNGNSYTNDKVDIFKWLFKFGLLANGFGDSSTNDLSEAEIKRFQNHYCIEDHGNVDITTWMAAFTSAGNPDRSAVACDTATIITEAKAQTLVDNGYEIVGRYLSGTVGGTTSKALTPAELNIIFSAGLKVFPIFQEGGNYLSYFEEMKGSNDALNSIIYAEALGMPYGTIIYFAVDFDAVDHQITSNIIPYFERINQMYIQEDSPYRIGIYGARNVCQRVCDEGFAISSFVCDMSTGFSGNLGFSIPDNWTFDQFANVTIGTGDGRIEVDKVAYSGRQKAVNGVAFFGIGDPIGGDNFDGSPYVWINRAGSRIPVYSSKTQGHDGVHTWYSYIPSGDIITYIDINEFYVMYGTGYSEGENYITNGDYVHKVLVNDDNGNMTTGYIQGHLELSESNQSKSYVPYQQQFHYFNYQDWNDEIVQQSEGGTGYTFTVSKPLRYYDYQGNYIGVLNVGDVLILKKSGNYATSYAGTRFPYRMVFHQRINAKTLEVENLYTTGGYAFVELGFHYGTKGADRALW